MGFVNRRSGVQSSQPAPLKTAYLLGFSRFHGLGKVGRIGEEQRSRQYQKQDHLFPDRSQVRQNLGALIRQSLVELSGFQ